MDSCLSSEAAGGAKRSDQAATDDHLCKPETLKKNKKKAFILISESLKCKPEVKNTVVCPTF